MLYTYLIVFEQEPPLGNIKQLAQKILSWPLVKVPLQQLNAALLAFASFSRLTSLLYHFVFFIPFMREQHATVTGKYRYHKNLNRPIISRSRLRRNIHRLEKGISMQPRRDNFGSKFIEETVSIYKSAAEQFAVGDSPIDGEELAWSQHVLEEYFSIVKGGVKQIDNAKKEFEKIPYQSQVDDHRKVPYKASSRKPSAVSYEDFVELCNYRRSVRWFKQKKVPRKLIDNALLAGRQSPSACNRLPYEFRFYDDPELVKKVSALPFGAAGYSHNIPTIAVVIGKLDSYFSARDRHAVYIDSALATMPFLLALETQGLSSSVINWPDFEPLEIKMQKLLGLDVSERPIMLIAIGYADPDGHIPYSQKKELSTLRSFNKT